MLESQNAAHPRHIAIVEADEPLRKSLEFVLEAHSYAVTSFATGGALLAALPALRADAFVLDHRLPDMSGPDLLKHMRAAEVSAPAMFIASNLSETLRRQAAALRAPVFDKPLMGETLRRAVEALLDGPQSRGV